METLVAIGMSFAVRTVLTLWAHDAGNLHLAGAAESCRALAASQGCATRADLFTLYRDAAWLAQVPETELAGEARALLDWLAPFIAADQVLQEAVQSCAAERR
jgi:hypothetical protein